VGGIILRISRDGTVLLDIYKQRLAEIESERADAVEKGRAEALQQEYARAMGVQDAWIQRAERKRSKGMGIYEAEQKYGHLVRYMYYQEGLTAFEIQEKFKIDKKILNKLIISGKNGM